MCKLTRESCCKPIPLPLTGGADEHFAVRKSCFKASGTVCDACKRPFVMHPVMGWKGTHQVVEKEVEQVSVMRGDDRVSVRRYHPGCFRPEGLAP